MQHNVSARLRTHADNNHHAREIAITTDVIITTQWRRKLKNETRVLHKKQQKWTSDSLFHVFLSEISWLREGIRVAGSYWELATNPSLMLALRGFLLLVNAAHLRREPLPNFLSPGAFSGCSWSRLVFPIPDTFLSLLLQERSIDVQIISIDVQILS